MITTYNKIKRHCQDMNIVVYHSVSRIKTRDEKATMYKIQIIYGSRNDTLESVETEKYIQMYTYATATHNFIWVKTSHNSSI